MRINFVSPISFNSLKMHSKNGIKFPEEFSCRNSKKSFYNVTIDENKSLGCYEICYKDDENIKPVARQDIMIWPEANYIYIDNMLTDEYARGKGLGTCMHLTNIIEMMENNVKQIELLSVSSAIPFHIKCGFKPIDKFEELRSNIRKIAKDDTPELQQFSKDAKELLKSNMSPELKSKLANKLLYNYTKKAIKVKSKKDQKYLFDTCISMQLTRNDVIKHKKLYNKLFDKYGIDYQISDCYDF